MAAAVVVEIGSPTPLLLVAVQDSAATMEVNMESAKTIENWPMPTLGYISAYEKVTLSHYS